MFTPQEIEMIIDALNMALASNKRMQVSKPKFSQMFTQIETELNNIKGKVNTLGTNTNKQK